MKTKCCRSRPRCAMCPVVLAAGARTMQASDDGDPFALLRAALSRAAPQRELPACVLDALRGLDRRERSAGRRCWAGELG